MEFIYMSELEKMPSEDIIKNIQNIAYFGSMELMYTSYIEVHIEKIEEYYKISAWILDDTEQKLQVMNRLTLNDIKNINIDVNKIDLSKLHYVLKEEIENTDKLYFIGLAVFDKYGNCLVED